MLAIPASGYLLQLGGGHAGGLSRADSAAASDRAGPALKELLKNVHIALNYTLLVLVALHVAGALKHQWLDRDGLLSRMLPFLK